MTNLMLIKEAEIIAAKSDQELLSLFSGELTGLAFQAPSEEDENEIRANLSRWFNKYKSKLHERLCTEELKLLHAPTSNPREKVLIILTIADVIAGIALGVSPITAAGVLVYYGLDKLCEND